MELEEAINHYLELKPCEKWIESVEPKFFFEFAETLIKYIKEESISKTVVEEKIKQLKEQSGGNVFHIQQTINSNIRLLQGLLNKGE